MSLIRDTKRCHVIECLIDSDVFKYWALEHRYHNKIKLLTLCNMSDIYMRCKVWVGGCVRVVGLTIPISYANTEF